MQFRTTFRLLGITLCLLSLSLLSPLIVNLIFHETSDKPFYLAFGCAMSTGLILWGINYKHHVELKLRDGFFFTILFWFVCSLFFSLPFVSIFKDQFSFTDAVFECVSGFTGSGGSVIRDLNDLSHAMLFYRQQLQLIGGIGIVVLAVAVIPLLGVGGMRLYRTETPGPFKESKWTPHIIQTVRALWWTYLLIVAMCMLSYKLAGMTWFDAIGESFATVSTGGFSTHNENFAYYKSDCIEYIGSFFMFLGAVNFGLHFLAIQQRSLMVYLKNSEFLYYLGWAIFSIILITFTLIHYGTLANNTHTLAKSVFNIISSMTTTGYVSAPIATWPSYVPMFLMLLSLIGGCAASTAGGLKILRVLLMLKQSKRELVTLLHPDAVVSIRLDQRSVPNAILQSTWSFISVFFLFFLASMLIFMALGNDFITSFSAIISALCNSGLGLGQVSQSFADLNDASKWVLIVTMLAGRLEVFALILFFTRDFWRRS